MLYFLVPGSRVVVTSWIISGSRPFAYYPWERCREHAVLGRFDRDDLVTAVNQRGKVAVAFANSPTILARPSRGLRRR